MIMLHTVVHGWGSRWKHPYKNIIARSMMKFQGKQTVNSLIVCTVLIAGGCFANGNVGKGLGKRPRHGTDHGLEEA